MYASDGIRDAVSGYVGQKSQTSGVYAYHRYAFVSYAAGCTQEGSVTTNTYHSIGLEIIGRYYVVTGNIPAHLISQEPDITIFNGNLITE